MTMTRAALVTLAAIMLLATQTAAVEVDVTWVGPSGGLWSTPGNWNPEVGGGTGPCNAGPVEFNVTIPAGSGTVVMDVADCSVKRLTLGDNRTLSIQVGAALTVLEDAVLCGIIDADGDFFAEHPELVSLWDRARFLVALGGHTVINAPEYASTGLWSDNGLSNVVTYNWTLMQAEDDGSLLDLSGIESIDAGFNSSGNDNDIQKINALNDGVIDLSGVTSVLAPSDWNDRVEFNATSGGVLDLSSLTTLTSASKGETRFSATAADIHLPSLGTMEQVRFLTDQSGTISASVTPAVFDSRGFWLDNGLSNVVTYNWTLMQADGDGSLLDLSGIESIDAGFNSSGNDNDIQKINALNGGVIDLSGVQSIMSPVDTNDRLELNVTGAGSLIDLSSMGAFASAGGGPTLIDVTDAGELIVGNLLLGQSVKLTAGDGGVLSIGGRLCYSYTVEADFDLGAAIVHFDGIDPQRVEIGGLDVDVFCSFLPDFSFGFGRMIVGTDDQPAEVHLRDDLDNGNQAGSREALYLFGLGETMCEGAVNGLRILGGSTLVLNELNAYAYVVDDGVHRNEWVHLNTLIPDGQDCVAYDEGMICRGTLSGPGDINGDGVVNVLDLLEVLSSWGPCVGCPADIDCTGEVDVSDLLLVLQEWADD